MFSPLSPPPSSGVICLWGRTGHAVPKASEGALPRAAASQCRVSASQRFGKREMQLETERKREAELVKLLQGQVPVWRPAGGWVGREGLWGRERGKREVPEL